MFQGIDGLLQKLRLPSRPCSSCCCLTAGSQARSTSSLYNIKVIAMQPSPEYLRTSEQASETSTEKQDQLIILDLNGTLCSRTKGTKTYHLRPHAKRFFDYIFTNYTVMVWSSAQVQSVKRMCKMFLPYKPGLTWDRSHFNLTTEAFYSNSETLKDLDLVWQISDDFNATNTIIIDDTSRKVSAQPYNLMLMSTFDHSVVEDTYVEVDLLKAIAYLKQARYQTNVTKYMKAHPFDVKAEYTIEKVEPYESLYIAHYVNGNCVNPLGKKSVKLLIEKRREMVGPTDDSKSQAQAQPQPQSKSATARTERQILREKRKEAKREKKRRRKLAKAERVKRESC